MKPWQVGDRVKIELAPSTPPTPRWDMHADCGGSGVFIPARISSILEEERLFEVKFDTPIKAAYGVSHSHWLLCEMGLIRASPLLRLVDKGSHYATEEIV